MIVEHEQNINYKVFNYKVFIIEQMAKSHINFN